MRRDDLHRHFDRLALQRVGLLARGLVELAVLLGDHDLVQASQLDLLLRAAASLIATHGLPSL